MKFRFANFDQKSDYHASGVVAIKSSMKIWTELYKLFLLRNLSQFRRQSIRNVGSSKTFFYHRLYDKNKLRFLRQVF